MTLWRMLHAIRHGAGSGVFYIGLGERLAASKVEAYPPGSVVIFPGNTPHFHRAKSGEYVTQVTAIGPLGLEYMDSRDDPREPNRQSIRSKTIFDPVSHRTIPGGNPHHELRRADPPFFMEVSAMIHELRVYQPVPGQMAKLQARSQNFIRLAAWGRSRTSSMPCSSWNRPASSQAT